MCDRRTDLRPTGTVRIGLLVVAIGLIGIFSIAVWLQPDSRGFGTHQQLGLPPCQLRQFLGIPCPHCGMTTSFSHVVRGNFRSALESNPLGIPLSVTGALCIPWCLVMAISGRWMVTRDPIQWLISGTIFYLFLAVVLWAIQLAIQLAT